MKVVENVSVLISFVVMLLIINEFQSETSYIEMGTNVISINLITQDKAFLFHPNLRLLLKPQLLVYQSCGEWRLERQYPFTKVPGIYDLI